jgi:hypothetical protein
VTEILIGPPWFRTLHDAFEGLGGASDHPMPASYRDAIVEYAIFDFGGLRQYEYEQFAVSLYTARFGQRYPDLRNRMSRRLFRAYAKECYGKFDEEMLRRVSLGRWPRLPEDRTPTMTYWWLLLGKIALMDECCCSVSQVLNHVYRKRGCR